MSKHFELTATIRTNTGTSFSKRDRALNNKVPAIIYGAGKEPVSINLEANKVANSLKNEAFYSQILTIMVGKNKEQVILKALQRHPAKAQILHMDFIRISADREITTKIPLHFMGEDKAPGVKLGGTFSHLQNDVEIKCLPKNLPEFITVDLSNIELDQSLHLSDITLPKGVVIPALSISKDNDLPIISLHKLRAQIIEEEKPAEEEVTEEASEKDDKSDKDKDKADKGKSDKGKSDKGSSNDKK